MTTEERLEKLERELAAAQRRNRWMLGGGILFILGCMVCLYTVMNGKIHVNTISAKMLIVEDEKGEGRACLAGSKYGPTLLMYDENYECRLDIGVTDFGGPHVYLRDEKGRNRAELSSAKDGPRLNLYDENGKNRATLVMFKVGPGLVLMDEKGMTRAELAASKIGPRLTLFDENQKAIWGTP